MPKRVRSPRRRSAATRSVEPPAKTLARIEAPAAERLLDRILDTPLLAHLVPHLPADVLHRVIQHCGLEDCGALVALATPAQLARVFDLDLWRAARPAQDQQFDADRFALWLEVMMESGADAAARILSGVDVALAITAFAHHVRVFDAAAIAPSASPDGDEPPDPHSTSDGLRREIGGYVIEAKGTQSWDAIVAVLCALDADHPVYFHRLMRGCRQLSNAGFELDGLDDLLDETQQTMFDLASSREQRRDQQGYLTPAQARAFLELSRQVRPGQAATPSANPIVRAYFEALAWTPPPAADSGSPRLLAASDAPSAAEDAADAVAAFAEVLRDAGIVPPTPRALLDGAPGETPRLARVHALMQATAERDPVAFSTRSEELAFLANALASGCSIQGRAFTPEEASDAVIAICNLGLEHWPPYDERLLVDHDTIGVFQAGWTILHQDVCMYAAQQLVAILKQLRTEDRETQRGLNALRVLLTKRLKAGTPWQARDALDVIATLDLPAWAGLLGLIAECPVLHAGVGVQRTARTVDANAFEFISEKRQLASVQAFMRSLPEILGPG